MKEKTAFFAVARKYLNDELWLSEPFTKGQAWVDLIGRASYEDGELTKRGELLISERGLAKRWKWSRGKVERYLDYLEKEGMIIRTTNRANTRATYGTTLRIEKYEDYQNPRATNRANSRATNRAIYNNIDNIDNISLYMPDGMEEQLRKTYGERADALMADVRNYYEGNTDKEFPGWPIAMAKFSSNQERWGKKPKKKSKTLEEIAAEVFAEMEEI